MKVKVEEFEVLPEDTYDGSFVNVEAADSATGGFWLWTFEIPRDGESRRMTAASSAKLTRATKAGQWVAAIQGRPVEPGEEFDFATIQGKPCRLLLSIEDTERGLFNRVDRILAPKPEQAKRRAKASKAKDDAPA